MAQYVSNDLDPRGTLRAGWENNFVELYSSVENVTKVLVTGTLAADSTAFGKWHSCSGTSADYTITLPTAVGNEGKMIFFTGDPDISVLSKLVTIDGNGTEKIGNSLTYAITTKGHLTIIARVTGGVGAWEIVYFDQGEFYPYTPTWTGFTGGDPTGPFYFKRGIGYVDLSFYTTSFATGTGTTLTFTLPLSLTARHTQRLLLPYFSNNGVTATVPGAIIVAINTNPVSAYTTVAGGAWTGSGAKGIAGSWRITTNE